MFEQGGINENQINKKNIFPQLSLEELLVPFVPKEFPPNTDHFTLGQDEENPYYRERNGYEARVEAKFDPRARDQRFDIIFHYPPTVQEKPDPFVDDFKRALKRRFKRSLDGAICGRDDSYFLSPFAVSAEVQEELSRLENLRTQTEKMIPELYKRHNLPETLPEKVNIGIGSKYYTAFVGYEFSEDGMGSILIGKSLNFVAQDKVLDKVEYTMPKPDNDDDYANGLATLHLDYFDKLKKQEVMSPDDQCIPQEIKDRYENYLDLHEGAFSMQSPFLPKLVKEKFKKHLEDLKEKHEQIRPEIDRLKENLVAIDSEINKYKPKVNYAVFDVFIGELGKKPDADNVRPQPNNVTQIKIEDNKVKKEKELSFEEIKERCRMISFVIRQLIKELAEKRPTALISVNKQLAEIVAKIEDKKNNKAVNLQLPYERLVALERSLSYQVDSKRQNDWLGQFFLLLNKLEQVATDNGLPFNKIIKENILQRLVSLARSEKLQNLDEYKELFEDILTSE